MLDHFVEFEGKRQLQQQLLLFFLHEEFGFFFGNRAPGDICCEVVSYATHNLFFLLRLIAIVLLNRDSLQLAVPCKYAGQCTTNNSGDGMN